MSQVRAWPQAALQQGLVLRYLVYPQNKDFSKNVMQPSKQEKKSLFLKISKHSLRYPALE